MTKLDSRDFILQEIIKSKSKLSDRINLEKEINSNLIFGNLSKSIDNVFAEEFEKAGGNLFLCNNDNEFIKNFKEQILKYKWKNLFCIDKNIQNILNKEEILYKSNQTEFNSMEAGITYCENLIARFGSVMISSYKGSGRKLNVFPPVHIIIAYSSQIVENIEDAFDYIQKKYNGEFPSMVSLITGPSRTADIEKTLIMGAHGPKELFLFLINNT
ncbi:MAG: LUD domain-containing protein [Bacteroidales bacterium]|nr:LUD domain-containing protein [Bacteroidales bacterium]